MNKSEPGVWDSDPNQLLDTNVSRLMGDVGVDSYEELHRWSVRYREEFWRRAVDAIGIRFDQLPSKILDNSAGAEQARWFCGATWNVAEACLGGVRGDPIDLDLFDPSATAIVENGPDGSITSWTLGELRQQSDDIAHSLHAQGIQQGDAVAILMPMNACSVAAYLGILKCGAVAVGIAESFSPAEIEVRLGLSRAKLLLAQAQIHRGAKSHSLYGRLANISAPPTIVRGPLASGESLRTEDIVWKDFIRPNSSSRKAVARRAEDNIGILFSSGTTGEPKAIPWTNLCSIKCAVDAHYHHDTRPGDCLAWPTSLGWMMGPWLIFASLMNRSTMALYDGLPTEPEFAKFVERAGVTMLGVVPSLVSAWRQSGILEDSNSKPDWSSIRMFSSTGECSNQEDMTWLMGCVDSQRQRPIIEYCGGTEIAGAYITGTLHRQCRAATFNTPTLGIDLVILDESGKPADKGEMYLIPPSIGLSSELLNGNHHEEYFENCPRSPQGETLRRHGDEMEALGDQYWRAHGRCDDTMNLGGIKVSSAEIERVLAELPGILELAAVAESPDGGGPSQLVIYAAPSDELDVTESGLESLRKMMQAEIRNRLNPLFKIHRVAIVERLPRTASNKIMRRRLRG